MEREIENKPKFSLMAQLYTICQKIESLDPTHLRT